MSKDKKDQIDATKEQFLNEINAQEDELMDEVAGGAKTGLEEPGDNINCPCEVNHC